MCCLVSRNKGRKHFIHITANMNASHHFVETVCCVSRAKKSNRPVVSKEEVGQVKLCFSCSTNRAVYLHIFMQMYKNL